MNYHTTGNEYISLPTLRESDGAAEGVTFLYMQVKGLLELRGKAGLIRPYMEAEGQRLPLHPKWTREHCWIPGFVSAVQGLSLSCVYLTPMGKRSVMLTIFGYSAPDSDKAAVTLLKKAWGDLDERQFEEVSVIDIISEKEMLKKWDQFIYSHHYRYTNNFFQSYLGMFPRRSCETVFATVQLNIPPDSNAGFHQDMTWYDIRAFLHGLLKAEKETPQDKNVPLYYTRKGW